MVQVHIRNVAQGGDPTPGVASGVILGNLPQGRMRPATIGVNRGPTGSEGWDVGCICTNMMPGERMGVPEPAWEDGIGVRGCPALRGTEADLAAPPSSLWGPAGGDDGSGGPIRRDPELRRYRYGTVTYKKIAGGGRTRGRGRPGRVGG